MVLRDVPEAVRQGGVSYAARRRMLAQSCYSITRSGHPSCRRASSSDRVSVRPAMMAVDVERWGYAMTVLVEQWAPDHDDDDVIVVSEEEFRDSARRSLEALGLTYAELAAQAAVRDFSSARAHALWVSIGGTVDL